MTHQSACAPVTSGSDGGDARSQAMTALENEFQTLFAQFRRLTMVNAHAVSEGMLPGAYKVFTTIAHLESATLSELTEVMVVDKGQMSRTLRDLDERGLINRTPDPSDGRSVRITVSDFGRERLAATRGEKAGALREAMEDWSVSDIERFSELLHALGKGIAP
ncbi:MarR family winged helix-turn-helix transcriptional regulator [Leucobacter sp. USHLN153]|uniref:MarR family winged helix-turn-helix transcriptional regulator n=1 Tax=Leucobacter sp. USHLN153 TaxID=3081268 RepID=UPI00301985F8